MTKPYPLDGYAPGNYICTCDMCDGKFEGDKHAYNCFSCAMRIKAFREKEAARKVAEEMAKPYIIQPEQIPDEVWKNLGLTELGGRAVAAAVLNAWPKASYHITEEGGGVWRRHYMIIPIKEEGPK